MQTLYFFPLSAKETSPVRTAAIVVRIYTIVAIIFFARFCWSCHRSFLRTPKCIQRARFVDGTPTRKRRRRWMRGRTKRTRRDLQHVGRDGGSRRPRRASSASSARLASAKWKWDFAFYPFARSRSPVTSAPCSLTKHVASAAIWYMSVDD